VSARLPVQRAAWERSEVVFALLLVSGAALQILILDPRPWDLGLAYHGGAEAWRSGHPEWVRSWMSTSFLAMVMAIVTRLTDEAGAVRALTVLNLAVVAVSLALVWGALRGRVSRAFWWVSLVLATFFAPLLSSLLYKQFNVLALFLAGVGFAAIRRDRAALGGALVGASVCLKPLALLLPLALLFRRDTRRAGLSSLVAIVVLTGLAQGFLALRAGDLGTLSPLPTIHNFEAKGEHWIYSQENFSPRGMLTRLARSDPKEGEGAFTRAASTFGVACFAVLSLAVLGSGRSWELFAFACLLSPMLGPVAWGHYQIMLAPMLLLLGCEFSTQRARWPHWLGLLVSLALADLLLRPLPDTVPGGLVWLATGRREQFAEVLDVMAVSRMAQFVLLATALSWFGRGKTRP
jgi:hypothetical protein